MTKEELREIIRETIMAEFTPERLKILKRNNKIKEILDESEPKQNK